MTPWEVVGRVPRLVTIRLFAEQPVLIGYMRQGRR